MKDQAELWCVHVQGPDSIVAQPSREVAEQRAKEWNAVAARFIAELPEPRRGFAPVVNCVVIPYPYGPERHAKQLAEHGGNPEDIC